MKNHLFHILLILVLVCFILLAIVIAVSGNTSEKEKLQEKVTQEIKYLDNIFVSMMNSLNNINFDNYSITVEKIKNNSQNLSGKQDNNQSSGDSGGRTITKW